MRQIDLTIKGEYGYLFEGESPGTFAFVPEDCIIFREDGTILIDRVHYFLRQWAARNMRFNSVETSGTHLFPNARKPVIKSDTPGFAEFLDHLRCGYGKGFVELPAVSAKIGG